MCRQITWSTIVNYTVQKKIRLHRSQHSVSPTSDHCSEDRCHVCESRTNSWIKMNSWRIRSIAHCTRHDIRIFTDSEKHRLKSTAKDRLCICLTTKWSATKNDETRWRQQKHSLTDSIQLTLHTQQRSATSTRDHMQNACWWYTDITDSLRDSLSVTNSLMIVVTICFLTEMFTGEKPIDDTVFLKQCRSRDNFLSWITMNESMKITSDWNDTNLLKNDTTKSITTSTVHWSHIDRNNSCFYLLHTIWQHSSCFLSERQSLQSFRSFKASTQFLQEFFCWRLLYWQPSDIRFFLNLYRKQHKILSFNSWHDQCERLCSCTNTWSERSWKKTSRLLTFYAKNNTHPRLFFIWKLCTWKTTIADRFWTNQKPNTNRLSKMCITFLQDHAGDQMKIATKWNCSCRCMMRFIVSCETVRFKNKSFSFCESVRNDWQMNSKKMSWRYWKNQIKNTTTKTASSENKKTDWQVFVSRLHIGCTCVCL